MTLFFFLSPFCLQRLPLAQRPVPTEHLQDSRRNREYQPFPQTFLQVVFILSTQNIETSLFPSSPQHHATRVF